MSAELVIKAIEEHADPLRAEHSMRFFKTAKGQYGYGDRFLGLTVPQMRTIAKAHRDLAISDLELLLMSPIHEERLVALLILVDQFGKYPEKRKQIFDFYLSHTKFVNNWDLVDLSAPRIVGIQLLHSNKSLLEKLAASDDLWEKRIAMVATATFIKDEQLMPTLQIAEKLLGDKHDLIHKAIGWMLREVGKKDEAVLEKFLKKHIKQMPRTTLRYAIERFDESKRKHYLAM
ncbi:DNA alkylation repair protein [Candidatus Woesebacteria bacterium RIFCSPHIGHO2_01_FULL_41_10]|uniref:DNA alkylation repair protein n=1 Tax=Candidatus Woesebacteria bacterium RIFCSPHIGHO2_01_FULL_41_10 TaxID=1802500 RepID=A0A1F7YQS9_9BACT|nr:MAG: DNA alkylation repair protein [Candidatus Woesebacteria bacterium RIFCSPHIGHO2_01_FULL_41_10]